MVRPRSDWPEESKRYGLGFWLHASSDVVMLEGYDAGVSFRSVHDPRSATTHTVISNTYRRRVADRVLPRREACDLTSHPALMEPGRRIGLGFEHAAETRGVVDHAVAIWTSHTCGSSYPDTQSKPGPR